eukprot:g4005.t1
MSLAKSWSCLERLVEKSGTAHHLKDFVNGPTSSQARLRLFNQPKSSVRVTLFRDHHAWCPYCQKVWLWLEEKQVPYRVSKVTMFCYGEKEKWYKRQVRSGMLPAIELDGRIITESDVILAELEKEFGPVGKDKISMHSEEAIPLRRLERSIFSAWCRWLCYRQCGAEDEEASRTYFVRVANEVEKKLKATPGPFFLNHLSIVDLIFLPYLERMNASLFYYKGFRLRDEKRFPYISNWFSALELRETYRGTQSDAHTHCHDLPPQMGGCYENFSETQQKYKKMIDEGPFLPSEKDYISLPDVGFTEPNDSAMIALSRVLVHRENVIDCAVKGCRQVGAKVNRNDVEKALLRTVAKMVGEEGILNSENESLPSEVSIALRYMRDRINVPRDMPLWSARRMRHSLEEIAREIGGNKERRRLEIPFQHRRDQDPREFGRSGKYNEAMRMRV